MPTERENDSGTARMTSTPSKATAGPWVAAKPGDYSDFDGDSIVILGDEKRIAVVHGKDREAKANASLIVAATDLLAACEAILPFIPKSSASEGGPNARSANVAAADMVRAAISRATGEA